MNSRGGTIKRARSVGATLLLAFAMTLTLHSVRALADDGQERMDAQTHDVVIQKLEESLKRAREDETINLAPVRARLADLYADRARLRAMSEAEKSCQDCKGALNDRLRALELYDVVVKEAPQMKKGPLLLQMAHLNELTLQPKKSVAIYERLATEGVKLHDKSVVAEALIGRAEDRFSNGKLEKAEVDFNDAIRLSPATRKGVLLSRLAWVHLNKGEQKKAVGDLIRILRTPDLMVRTSSTGTSFDPSFQEDVAQDLATFMARGEVNMRDIRLLESLAPEKTKGEVLKHFASECDRLGQKPAAIDAWAIAVKYEKDPSEHLEALVRVAQLRFDLGQREAALVGMKTAVDFWQHNACVDAKPEQTAGGDQTEEARCEQLHQRLRKLVLDWNRVEKKAPTTRLLAAYNLYLVQFPQDAEMSQWAADTARTLKKYPEASVLYHKTSLLAAGKPGKEMQNILETAVVGEIEMAELTKNKQSREAAYEHYLALNPNGAVHAKVRYQRAHVAYERNDSREASQRFHEFASSKDCRPAATDDISKLCVQAADLDLDSLAILKDNPQIEARATEYASIYKSRQMEYLKIARTSVLKQSENVDAKAALAKLNTINLAGATTDERVRYYKTRISLAEKAQDLDEVRVGADGLLKTKGLSEADHEYALGRIAWADEMSLDFTKAYNVTTKMRLSSMRADEREMKLSLLAELAGKNARPHQEAFLRLTHDRTKAALVRAKLVRSSRAPVRELEKYDSDLRRYPQIYAPLALEVFARSGDVKLAQRALSSRAVASQPAGQAIRRELFFREFAKLDHEIARHKIRSYSDQAMQKTLGERLKMLAAVEQAGNEAISSGDWPSQLLTLDVASRENKRINGDILSLPVPRKLKGAARQNYITTVAQQANVYLKKHEAIDRKLQEFWTNKPAFDAIIADYGASRPELRPMLSRELRQIGAASPASVRAELDNGVASVDLAKLAQEESIARADAKQKPFSSASLERFRKVESARGHETMVTYLDTRLVELKGDEPVKGASK